MCECCNFIIKMYNTYNLKASQLCNMFKLGFKVIILLLFLTSCVVYSPKYSTFEKVMTLKLGMTRSQVEEILGVQPYNLKAYTDTSSVYIYVYRVTERKTMTFNTKPVNGKKKIGNYIQLFVTYSKDGKVKNIESCTLCPDNLEKRSNVDFEKIITFLVYGVPLLLVIFTTDWL